MSTWQGALVRVEDTARFVKLAKRHRIGVTDPSGPWVLVEDEPRLGQLGPPRFSKDLSREMSTSVIAFFLQTTVTNERVEHWESGKLVRELEYYLDGGGWIAQNGIPQSWEAPYFFCAEEGTNPGMEWPHNLAVDISDDDIIRYEQAKSAMSPSSVMDLLTGGSIPRLCRFFGVDPGRPGAHHTPPRNWRLIVAVVALLVVLVGAFIIGATK